MKHNAASLLILLITAGCASARAGLPDHCSAAAARDLISVINSRSWTGWTSEAISRQFPLLEPTRDTRAAPVFFEATWARGGQACTCCATLVVEPVTESETQSEPHLTLVTVFIRAPTFRTAMTAAQDVIGAASAPPLLNRLQSAEEARPMSVDVAMSEGSAIRRLEFSLFELPSGEWSWKYQEARAQP